MFDSHAMSAKGLINRSVKEEQGQDDFCVQPMAARFDQVKDLRLDVRELTDH